VIIEIVLLVIAYSFFHAADVVLTYPNTHSPSGEETDILSLANMHN